MSKPKEYYRELLDGFAASGKNVSEFCKDIGITKSAYYYAKSRLEQLKQKEEKKEMRKKEQKDFVKVTVAEDSVTAYIGESRTKVMMDLEELAELLKRL